MKYLGLALILGLLATPLFAQTQATPSNKFAIDQAAPDLATAQAYVYKIYVDGGATGAVVTMTCSGTASPFLCTTPVGSFTPGAHTVTFTAANAAGESAKSAGLSFIMVIIPAVPQNPRLQ